MGRHALPSPGGGGVDRSFSVEVDRVTSKNDQKVAVAYAHPENVPAAFHASLLRLFVFDATQGRGRVVAGGAHIPVLSGAQITKTRNRIVRDFLKLEGIDWLFM